LHPRRRTHRAPGDVPARGRGPRNDDADARRRPRRGGHGRRDTYAHRERIMNEMLRNLREQLPSTEDVLHQVGLQYERNAAMSSLSMVTAFAMGALTGAVLATLFAPRAGHEVREELNQRVREFGDRMGWSDRRAGDDEAAAH